MRTGDRRVPAARDRKAEARKAVRVRAPGVGPPERNRAAAQARRRQIHSRSTPCPISPFPLS